MTGEMVRNIVLEDENELELKEYLHKIENIFGTDYALACLTSHVDMAKSINLFSSKLQINNSTITFILLKSYILSSKNDDITKIINNYVYTTNIDELIYLIKNNFYIKKRLVRNFIEQKKDNQKLYKLSNDKNYIIETLSILRDYKRERERNNYINKNNLYFSYYAPKKRRR